MSGFFGGGQATANKPTPINALQVQTSVYGTPVALIYGRNRVAGQMIDYVGFRAISHTEKQEGGKGGSPPKQTSFTYRVTFMLALGEGTINAVNRLWKDAEILTLGTAGLTFFNGSPTQTGWSYLSSNFPSHALNYANTAYVAGADYDLGGDSALPNFNFDVSGFGYTAVKEGAKPSFILSDYLTHAQHGAGFNFLNLTDTRFDTYCLARDLYLSPVEDTQRPASAFIKELSDLTNCGIVWSQGKLTFVPYGDETITANSTTYTPNLTPVYDISIDDYSSKRSKGYVQIERKVLEQSYNHIQLEIVDKDNNYLQTVVEAKDQADIDARGLRSKSVIKAHSITNVATGRDIAQLMLQRELYVRRTFNFSLKIRHSLLDLMDMLTLNDPIMGLNQQLVRIISIEEQDDGLDVIAEEVLQNAAHAPLYTTQSPGGFLTDHNASPGSVATPMLINAPALLCPDGYELWIAAYGASVNWGGAQVWLSKNGVDYANVGFITSPARMGTLNTALNSYTGGTALDTANTLDVTIGKGQLLSTDTAGVTDFLTLSYVDGGTGEFLAYKTATLTGALRYALTNLQRGGYGTTAGTSAIGAKYARIDENIFRLPYDRSLVNKTVYIKLCSYNIYGTAIESLASVTAYSIVLKPNIGNGPMLAGDFGGSGANLLWDEYSRFAGTLPTLVDSGSTISQSYDAATSLTVAPTGSMKVAVNDPTGNVGTSFFYLGNSTTDYNVALTPGKKYIFSVYAKGSVAGKLRLQLKGEDGVTYTAGTLNDPAITTGVTRVSCVIDLTTFTGNQVLPIISCNMLGLTTAFNVWIDRVMIEEMKGTNRVPSAWLPGSAGRTAAAAAAAATAAQTAATAAQGDATTALNGLSDASNDNILTPAEKKLVIGDVTAITNEQAGIDAQATAFAIGTEKTTYDAAVTALTAYNATLTSPFAWNNMSGNTTIVRTTFRQKFLDVYNAKQALLNVIYATAKAIADSKIKHFFQNTAPYASGGTVGDLWTNPDTGITARWDGGTWVTSAMYAVNTNGVNMIVNSTFMSNMMGQTYGAAGLNNKQLVDGWVVTRQEGANGSTSYLTGAAGVVRSQVSGTTVTVPASGLVAPQIRTLTPFAVEPGSTYSINFNATYAFNGALTAGITANSRMFVDWLDSAGAHISFSIIARPRGTAAGWGAALDCVAPTNATSAHVYLDTIVQNSNGTATVAATSSVALQTNFTAVSMVKKSLLAIPGSGVQIGDTRNLLQINVGNGTAKVPTVISYTAAAGTPATSTISVAAWTMLSGSVSVAYGAKTVGVTGTNGTNVTYFLYLDDPTFSGTGTLVATTNGNLIFQGDGRIYIGTVTVAFPSSGSGSGGGFSGGGGNSCVCVDMSLNAESIAIEARPGMILDCLDLPVSDQPFKRRILAVEFDDAECVEIITSNGAVWRGASSTPFDLLDGRVAYAPQMLGEYVVGDRGISEVVTVTPIGSQPVAHVHLGGISYAAGEDPTNRIYSHNALKP